MDKSDSEHSEDMDPSIQELLDRCKKNSPMPTKGPDEQTAATSSVLSEITNRQIGEESAPETAVTTSAANIRCSTKFRSNAGLKCHMRKHKERNPFPCNKCDKIFRNKVDLKFHMQVHGEGTIACKICGFKARSRSGMFTHREMHNPTVQLCSECGKQFLRKSYLKQHMATHSNSFECDVENCGKKFGRKHHLQSHMNLHKVDMFACDQCSFTTKHKRSLDRHFSTHETDKSPELLCVHCGIPYQRKSNLERHEESCKL